MWQTLSDRNLLTGMEAVKICTFYERVFFFISFRLNTLLLLCFFLPSLPSSPSFFLPPSLSPSLLHSPLFLSFLPPPFPLPYRLVATEEENKQLKIEMSELRARHRIELERVNQTKEREMAEVHERVKQALEKKEENLRTVRVQHEAALKRADHLEMLLERQRKELIKK